MRIPRATYRIQFTPEFGFQSARKTIDYLRILGVSDLYASPIFKARPGSQHGYDLLNSNCLNPELGTQEDFEDLMEDIQAKSLGWIQDIVPNHMAFGEGNRMLMDIFETGKDSPYLTFFDIDWNHYHKRLKGKLLAPFLGKPLQEAFNQGEIRLAFDEKGFCVRHFSLRFPVKISSYPMILNRMLGRRKKTRGQGFSNLKPIERIIEGLNRPKLPAKKRAHLKHQLLKRSKEDPKIQRAIQQTLYEINNVNKPFLKKLLGEQTFHLAFWKTANRLINYRRFFTVNDLISVRVEVESVFRQLHGLIIKLCREKKFSGIRLDHIDGLYNPASYLKKLRQKTKDPYLVVEKILHQGENLPSAWPVQGTTGYEFLNCLNGLFCQNENEKAFQKLYKRFTKQKKSLDALIYENKKHIIKNYMAGDIENLSLMLLGIVQKQPFQKKIPLKQIKKTVTEFLACFPVYRTYVDQKGIESADGAYIENALQKAKQRHPELKMAFSLLSRMVEMGTKRNFKKKGVNLCLQWVKRIQQFTGPVMAKGFEDTSLYHYNRLLSLNEVGGDPGQFGIKLEAWHRFNGFRRKEWPHTMNASSTHDTKRGEDVRARINVLSEDTRAWEQKIDLWHAMNRNKKTRVRNEEIPDKNVEYFLYQTLIGTFPFSGTPSRNWKDRIKSYMIKAAREEKVHTDWIDPQPLYEKALLSFIEGILQTTQPNAFLEDFKPFQRKISFYGILNALSQTLIKITAPGVPDFYQGTELWDLSLVDPDNRRAVDYRKRTRYLFELEDRVKNDPLGLIKRLWRKRSDGRIKLYTLHRALEVRNSKPALFSSGSYHPISAKGKFKNHIISFARQEGTDWAITVAPRFLSGILREETLPAGESVWQDTILELPPECPLQWKDALTGKALSNGIKLGIGQILKHFPVALLVGKKTL